MRGRRPIRAILGLLVCLGSASAFGAGPGGAGNAQAAQVGATGIAIQGVAGAEVRLTPEALAALPPVQVTLSSEPGHGPAQRRFEGPLLWTVLVHAGAINPSRFRDHVRQLVSVTGSDGYTAVLALGEISPEFESKQVVLALRMDGVPIAAEHLRLVVPGDKRGGRGVHDLVRIAVRVPPSAVPPAP